MRIRNSNRNSNNEPLSNEQLQAMAPSAFAIQPYEKQSDRYTFIPTSVVIDGMRNAGFQPMSAQQSRTRIEGKKNFTKHMIRFRPSDQTVAVVGDSAVEIILINAHDGSSRYDLSCGVFRLACLNGMMVSDGLVESTRIRHTGDILDAVISATEGIIAQAPKIIEAVREWKGIELSQPEQMILAQSAYNLRFEEANLFPVEKLLQTRRYADTSNDLYTVFNRVQENVIKGGLKHSVRNEETGRIRRARTREVVGIDQNSKLNRELWAIATKMAELKR